MKADLNGKLDLCFQMYISDGQNKPLYLFPFCMFHLLYFLVVLLFTFGQKTLDMDLNSRFPCDNLPHGKNGTRYSECV